MAARVEQAKTLVTGLPSDAANVFITLTSRNLNKDLMIIARGEYVTTEKKLLQAGANRVVMPAVIGAQRMATMITRPSTADLMELVADRTILDAELDEFTVPKDNRLVGCTVRVARHAQTQAVDAVGRLPVHGLECPRVTLLGPPNERFDGLDGFGHHRILT